MILITTQQNKITLLYVSIVSGTVAHSKNVETVLELQKFAIWFLIFVLQEIFAILEAAFCNVILSACTEFKFKIAKIFLTNLFQEPLESNWFNLGIFHFAMIASGTNAHKTSAANTAFLVSNLCSFWKGKKWSDFLPQLGFWCLSCFYHDWMQKNFKIIQNQRLR